MEDRYQAHKVLYLIGLLSMLSCSLHDVWPVYFMAFTDGRSAERARLYF